MASHGFLHCGELTSSIKWQDINIDVPAHLATRPVCRRARRQMGRPICQHFVPSADGTAHLQTFCPVCKHLRRYDQSGDFFNPRRCDAGRRAYCPTILTTSCSFCSFTFCFLSSFFSVLQVFISSLKDGNPGII